MRRLTYLLIALTLFISACENGFNDEGKNQISLSTKTIKVDFESDEHTIKVTSPYSWIAESKNEWIYLTCDNGIAGTEELRFVCDRNLEESERKGTIVIKNGDFGLATELYVTQKSFIPELVVDQSRSLSFTEKGGTDIIKVSSNFNYDVSDDASWISCYKVEEGVKVSVSASNVVNERTAKITIYSEKYNLSYDVGVSQGAFEPYLNVYTSELNFNSENSSQYVSISANASFGVSSSATWLYCTTENGMVKITAYKNTTTELRTASVRVYLYEYNLDAIIKVTQEAFVPVIEVNGSTNIGIDVEAKSGTVKIVATSNFDYKISTNVDWLSFQKENNKLAITYTTNLDIYNNRLAEITLYSDIYTPKVIINLTQTSLPRSHVIFYTSSDDRVVKSKYSESYGFLSNTYENGEGIIRFNSPITGIPTNAFKNQSSLTSITFPDCITNIGNDAFCGCSSLTSITLPDGITEIGDHAFHRCISLKNVVIPNNTNTIGYESFYECTSLENITIGRSVSRIESRAFMNCYSLTSITIPESVGYIGDYAFYDCIGLKNIYCKAQIPPSIGYDLFYYWDSSYPSSDKKLECVIYVPNSSITAYTSSPNWEIYKHMFVGCDFE